MANEPNITAANSGLTRQCRQRAIAYLTYYPGDRLFGCGTVQQELLCAIPLLPVHLPVRRSDRPGHCFRHCADDCHHDVSARVLRGFPVADCEPVLAGGDHHLHRQRIPGQALQAADHWQPRGEAGGRIGARNIASGAVRGPRFNAHGLSWIAACSRPGAAAMSICACSSSILTATAQAFCR